mmetsp:Transcript_81385/g.209510  ORF Transcript_81385/g.209510 Transcript_81385/m.209510 type:complete len:278 (+) Transcript_81385:3-836(+)
MDGWREGGRERESLPYGSHCPPPVVGAPVVLAAPVVLGALVFWPAAAWPAAALAVLVTCWSSLAGPWSSSSPGSSSSSSSSSSSPELAVLFAQIGAGAGARAGVSGAEAGVFGVGTFVLVLALALFAPFVRTGAGAGAGAGVSSATGAEASGAFCSRLRGTNISLPVGSFTWARPAWAPVDTRLTNIPVPKPFTTTSSPRNGRAFSEKPPGTGSAGQMATRSRATSRTTARTLAGLQYEPLSASRQGAIASARARLSPAGASKSPEPSSLSSDCGSG